MPVVQIKLSGIAIVCVDMAIVLVRPELAFLGCCCLQTLLRACIGVADLKREPLTADRITMEVLNDDIADFAGLEPSTVLVGGTT